MCECRDGERVEERGSLEKWERGQKENKRRKKKRKRNKKKAAQKKRGTHPRGRPNGRAGHCTRLRECNSLQLHRERLAKTSTRSCAPVQCPT